jgi:hypothetical protein
MTWQIESLCRTALDHFLYGLVQVKREVSTVLISRIYRNGVQQSAPEAACPGSEWAIPMFRAKIPHFTSKTVEHSRYLPTPNQHFDGLTDPFRAPGGWVFLSNQREGVS